MFGMSLKEQAREAVIQGYDHDVRITNYFKVLVKEARAEFYEDNKPTLDSFLREQFEKALEQE